MQQVQIEVVGTQALTVVAANRLAHELLGGAVAIQSRTVSISVMPARSAAISRSRADERSPRYQVPMPRRGMGVPSGIATVSMNGMSSVPFGAPRSASGSAQAQERKRGPPHRDVPHHMGRDGAVMNRRAGVCVL